MIKTWQQRCEEHPDHEGIVSTQMIMDRMQEEIDELRQALSEPVPENFMDALRFDVAMREWVGLTKEEMLELFEKYSDRPFSLMLATHDKVKEKNT